MRSYCPRLDPLGRGVQTHKVSISFSARPGPQSSRLNTARCPLSCLSAPPPPLRRLPPGRGQDDTQALFPRLLPPAGAARPASCPSAGAHCSSGGGWGWGVLTALELAQRRGDQSCSSSEPSGDPLHPPRPGGKVCSLWAPQCPWPLTPAACARAHTCVPSGIRHVGPGSTPSPFTHTFQIFVPTVGRARPSPVARR